jgi:hypothetical protein
MSRQQQAQLQPRTQPQAREQLERQHWEREQAVPMQRQAPPVEDDDSEAEEEEAVDPAREEAMQRAKTLQIPTRKEVNSRVKVTTRRRSLWMRTIRP